MVKVDDEEIAAGVAVVVAVVVIVLATVVVDLGADLVSALIVALSPVGAVDVRSGDNVFVSSINYR